MNITIKSPQSAAAIHHVIEAHNLYDAHLYIKKPMNGIQTCDFVDLKVNKLQIAALFDAFSSLFYETCRSNQYEYVISEDMPTELGTLIQLMTGAEPSISATNNECARLLTLARKYHMNQFDYTVLKSEIQRASPTLNQYT